MVAHTFKSEEMREQYFELTKDMVLRISGQKTLLEKKPQIPHIFLLIFCLSGLEIVHAGAKFNG